MSRKKRTAGDDEDVPVVQKRVKTRAQTQQRVEEEAQGLIATTRGMFTLHSFVLLKISYRLEGSRRVKEKAEKAEKNAGEFTRVQSHLPYSLSAQCGRSIRGRMGKHHRSRPRQIQIQPRGQLERNASRQIPPRTRSMMNWVTQKRVLAIRGTLRKPGRKLP